MPRRIRIGFGAKNYTLDAHVVPGAAQAQAATLTGTSQISFTPAAPFSVSGTVGNGNPLTITRSSGTFAPKSFGSGAPQLYDTCDKQWLNGVNQNAYSGFADGQTVAHLLYQTQASDNPGGMHVGYYTSRTKRTPVDSAQYASPAMVSSGKGWLGFPSWPAEYGAKTNQSQYFTYWARSKLGFNGGAGSGDSSTKQFRIAQQGDQLIGGQHNYIAAGSQGFDLGVAQDSSSFAGIGTLVNQWHRHELYLNLTTKEVRWWLNGAFMAFTYSGYGGSYEVCQPANTLYVANAPNTAWDPAKYAIAFNDCAVALFGWDDGHGLSAGNDYDIAQVYVDPDYQRFEITDSATWDSGLTATANRELQGRWSRNSPTQCTVYQYQGQFSGSISGKVLWYVSSLTTAEKVGVFS